MRLKSININERSSTFSNEEQKNSLNDMSVVINQIGEIFDNVVQLEEFVLQNIHEELSILIGIRMNKEKIVNEKGMKVYLSDYFSPSAYKVEEKIEKALGDWNTANDRSSVNEIKGALLILKKVSETLKNVGVEKYKSVGLLKDLIDEFGYFQVAKVILNGNIVDRISILTKLKSEVETIFAPPKKDEPKEPAKRRKKLTIDDL